MGVIDEFQTTWEKDARWTPGFRIYKAPSYIKYNVPPSRLLAEKRHEYRVRIDLIVYLCELPDLSYPLIIGEIKGILIVNIFDKEYPGGLDQWISDASMREVEGLLSRSKITGFALCENKYDINTYDEQYLAPIIHIKIPKYMLGQLEYLDIRKESTINKEEKMAIQKEIDHIKSRYKIK